MYWAYLMFSLAQDPILSKTAWKALVGFRLNIGNKCIPILHLKHCLAKFLSRKLIR